MGFRITVEVPLFLTFFGFMLSDSKKGSGFALTKNTASNMWVDGSDSVNTNLLIYRTCYIILGFDKHNCSLLGNTDNNITKELEKLVQPKADVISMVKTIVDSVSAAVLSLFVGAWSDRFGRKPVLVMSIMELLVKLEKTYLSIVFFTITNTALYIATQELYRVLEISSYTLMNLVMVVYSAIENVSPWFMMTCSIPVILTGGGSSLLTILLAYLTDVTSDNERGFRMGIFEATMGVAVLAGSLSSSYVFKAIGYVAVFSIAATGCALALIYTWFLLPESLEVIETRNRIKGFFELENMSGLFRTSFRNRPHFHRAIILLIMFALAVYFVTIFGDGSVMFLFMREKFQWTLRKYTLYSSACNVMWISSTLFIVYVVHHRLHVKETILIFVGFISLMIGPLIQGLAQVDWLIYMAAVVKIPSGGISPMTRSLLSKLVDINEVGKIFALFTLTQNLLGLVGSPVFTTLYNATIDTNPGAFNFLTASAHAVNTLCLLIVLMLQKRSDDNRYAILQTDNGQENEEIVTNGANNQTDLVING